MRITDQDITDSHTSLTEDDIVTADPTEGMSWSDKFYKGAGSAFKQTGQGIRQLTGPAVRLFSDTSPEESLRQIKSLQSEIAETRKIDEPIVNTLPGFLGNVTGHVAMTLPLSIIPGGNALRGATAIGAGLGAVQPVVEGEDRFKNMLLGGLFGAGGYGVGSGLGKVVRSASDKVARIEARAAEKASATAAAETASARSAAGNAAQNAYRQLEHLRELKAMGLLTKEQAAIAKNLENELAEKAAEKLLPAVAQKEAAALAYKEAIESEAKRAADLASKALSKAEVKNQIKARIKRYGPAAVGGVLGNAMFPGLGGAVGGAATGLVLRPAVRSMINLGKNPAVQHELLSPFARAQMLAHPSVPNAFGLIGPSIYASQQ